MQSQAATETTGLAEGFRQSRRTSMGRKIHALGKRQHELAGILGLTQQSVSGKLTGKIAVTINDLEKLSAACEVPIIYFFLDEGTDPEKARAVESLIGSFPEDTLSMLGRLSKAPKSVRDFILRAAVQSIGLYEDGVRDGNGTN